MEINRPVDTVAAPLDILKSRFGYDSFRGLQEEIIANVLDRHDSLALMPTGAGKSLCYQLPALIFKGTTLVISPLIALMKDQVDALNANGIPARYINSSQPSREIEQAQSEARQGQVRMLYVAPERLALSGFRSFLHSLDLSLIAIDEAHCISEWGHEFRPDYRNLLQMRQEFPEVPVIALTATATERVREDIISQLGLHRGQVFLSSFNRPNLSYSVHPKSDSLALLMSMLRKRRGQSAIIYCFSRRETEELADDLNKSGFEARPYHAGLDAETRSKNQEDFVRDRVPIIVATIAFGMGIDKPDVRLVVHNSLPRSLEGYYQETGRAGRDGLPSECVLFFAYGDKARQDYFLNQIESADEQRNAREKLNQMMDYAQTPTCRRRTLLEYFGEEWTEENCGSCDVCLREADDFDATEVALKILSAVVRTGERFGAVHIIQVLTGSREKRILDLGHDRLSVHGIVKDFQRTELREIIGHLRARGLLALNEGEFPTLTVTPGGREFLQQREKLTLPRPQTPEASDDRRPGSRRPTGAPALGEYDEKLFDELRTLRRRLADTRNVPPYVVFGDVSLRHMAAVIPQTLEEFGRIHGVGQAKLQQYGADFLKVICAYAEANDIPAVTYDAPSRERPAPDPQERDRGHGQRGRGATFETTRDLLAQGLTISQIAEHRGLAATTILGHLERISDQGEILDLTHILPPSERLDQIEIAFRTCGSVFLHPVWEYLGPDFTYEELRLVRIHLRQQGRLEEE